MSNSQTVTISISCDWPLVYIKLFVGFGEGHFSRRVKGLSSFGKCQTGLHTDEASPGVDRRSIKGLERCKYTIQGHKTVKIYHVLLTNLTSVSSATLKVCPQLGWIQEET